MPPTTLLDRIRTLVRRDRLLDTATRMIAVPSPTGDAGAVSDALADLLRADGFAVQREAASHAGAPAVIARLEAGNPGKCLQFNGHLDVVHLPFVPPRAEGNLLRGSGSCDMKGGTAAAIEALRALRDGGLLDRGSVMFVAHDLHEAPWGLGEQIDALIRAGIHGDAVLIPEALNQHLPVIGRGSATWKVVLSRSRPPVHEVMRPPDEPSVIAAGASLARRIGDLDAQISSGVDSPAGKPSAFIGQIHAGEIYNQYPQKCMLEGTRRWLPGTDPTNVEREFRELVAEVGRDHDVSVDLEWRFIRGAFELDAGDPFVTAFQQSHAAVTGSPLPTGPKLFVDDGNSFSSLAKIPAITHGPRGGGQHTVEEWVDIDDLVRVAVVYALTAVTYLNE
ncbi:MAG TPA: M20 family metallopeptidase [Gemmataceae bacterium]|jgi:acetylornithine deacetylase/succinyl-diaminopimelate desuccinylase-like protein|nr:M20 family metallopeptidase [Gemmataceae bacterium]